MNIIYQNIFDVALKFLYNQNIYNNNKYNSIISDFLNTNITKIKLPKKLFQGNNIFINIKINHHICKSTINNIYNVK